MKKATLLVSEEEQKRIAFGSLLSANVGFLPQEVIDMFSQNERRAEIPGRLIHAFTMENMETEVQILSTPILDLRSTGRTFSDWLHAREQLHHFLTGGEEIVILEDMFQISPELLSRTDIIPVFRPVGVTNRTALDWKVKLGMKASYEEDAEKGGVMMYKNSGEPKTPELYYIHRSVRPDEDTLGKHAMSPDQLIAVPNKKWLNLYGWSDADNLHFLITGQHLDSGDTWTWFPEDRLQGDDRVARASWNVGNAQAGFDWYYRGYCYPGIGARVAIPIPLKPQS